MDISRVEANVEDDQINDEIIRNVWEIKNNQISKTNWIYKYLTGKKRHFSLDTR